MKSKYFKKIIDDKIQCQTCNHYCIISNGKYGLCKTRKNVNKKLDYIYWGKIISQSIDPIEKKPLYHFLPGTDTYSVCAPGCNFKCLWCQNYEISQLSCHSDPALDAGEESSEQSERSFHSLDPSIASLLRMTTIKPQKIVNSAIKYNCPSISYTYTEPSLMGDWAIETMKLAHKNHLKNIFVSNGYMSKEFLKDLLPLLDAINIDLKFMDEKKYLKYSGAKLEPILENIEAIYNYRLPACHSERSESRTNIPMNCHSALACPDECEAFRGDAESIQIDKNYYIDSRLRGNDRERKNDNKIHLELTTLIIPGLNDSKKEMLKLAQFIYDLDKSIPYHISRFYPHYKLKDLPPTDIKTLKLAKKIGKNIGLKNVYIGNV